MIDRFKVAYKLCSEEVAASCSIQFNVDESTESIRQSCYFSHDPDAIYRPDCDLVHLNARCEYRPVVYARTEDAGLAEIELALAAIPTQLSYHDRLPVSLTAMVEVWHHHCHALLLPVVGLRNVLIGYKPHAVVRGWSFREVHRP